MGFRTIPDMVEKKKKKKIMEKKSVKKQISGLLWTSSRNMEIMCTV